MRGWAMISSALVLAISAWALAQHGPTATSIGADDARTVVHHASWGTPARAHPHGPEVDEVSTMPLASAWSSKGASLWTGAGRHPMWRGCQHRYDPALSSFIFGSASTSG
jgi:hypothetical protein